MRKVKVYKVGLIASSILPILTSLSTIIFQLPKKPSKILSDALVCLFTLGAFLVLFL